MKTLTKMAGAVLAGAGAAAMLDPQRKRSDFSFRDRSVVITGGSRGLGLVMARQLAEEGAKVTILARDGAELDRAVRDIAERGGEAFALPCDVTDRQQVEGAIERVIERDGRIDVLVNNAGIIQVGPVEHMKLEDFESAMAVHMWGPLYTMLTAIPHMRKAGGGRIVNISSIGGKIAVPHLLPYSASKFALVGLSDGMRAELARDNIQVTTVAPGLMRTGSPFNALFKGDHKREFAWFVILDSLPVTSISADRAARQIIEAARRGDPELTVTIQARLAIVANTLFPGLFARAMQVYNSLLPKPREDEGTGLWTGWDSRTPLSESPLTALTHKAAEANNETVPQVPAMPADGAEQQGYA